MKYKATGFKAEGKGQFSSCLLPDALYETLRVACNSYRVSGLALSVRVASRREAMPFALASPLGEGFTLRYLPPAFLDKAKSPVT